MILGASSSKAGVRNGRAFLAGTRALLEYTALPPMFIFSARMPAFLGFVKKPCAPYSTRCAYGCLALIMPSSFAREKPERKERFSVPERTATRLAAPVLTRFVPFFSAFSTPSLVFPSNALICLRHFVSSSSLNVVMTR